MTGYFRAPRVNGKLTRGAEMNTMTKFAAAAASFLAFSVTAAASQAAVYLGIEQDGGGIVTVDSGASGAAYASAFGNFELTVDSVTPGSFPFLIGSASHANNSAGGDAGTLDIYGTVDNISGPIPIHFLSTLTSNVVPAGWTIRLRTYVDAGNGLYGGTLLSDATYTAFGADQFHSPFVGGAGPYSVTARYTITAPTQSSTGSLATISIAAVPEPGTWALMIMGFGGAGAMIRSRRKAMVAA